MDMRLETERKKRKRPDKRKDLKICTWNVKTINGKEEEVGEEMKKYGLGHVKRMENKRRPKKIMETRMEGKRARGRPRTSWIDSITSAGKKRQKTLVEMNRMVTNRKE